MALYELHTTKLFCNIVHKGGLVMWYSKKVEVLKHYASKSKSITNHFRKSKLLLLYFIVLKLLMNHIFI